MQSSRVRNVRRRRASRVNQFHQMTSAQFACFVMIIVTFSRSIDKWYVRKGLSRFRRKLATERSKATRTT